MVAALRNAGYDTVEKILDAGAAKLGELPGFDAETVEAVLAAAESERAAQPQTAAEPAVEPDAAAESTEEPVAAVPAEGGEEKES